MKLAILITGNLESGLETAQRWHEAGAPGVTMIRGYGIHSLRSEVERGEVELPRMVVSMASAMAAIIEQMEANAVIVLSVVNDDLVDALLATTNQVLGDLSQPNTGVVFILPVDRAYGVRSFS